MFRPLTTICFDEAFVLLRGKVKVTTHNDDGSVIESILLEPAQGICGVDIPKNVWHTLRSLDSGTVILEMKDGAYEPIGEEDILEL